LRWGAEEDLIYGAASRTLHRAACLNAPDTEEVTRLAAGSSLELVWAPRMCRCSPDVTVGLG
jgi:hypothetical protein